MVIKINIVLVFVILLFVNGEDVTYRAKNVETLVIFSFGKINETDGQNVISYIDYLNNLVSLRDVNKNIFDQKKISMQLYFGKYNATDLLNAADDENNTIAFIVLKNNQEFTDNVTQEANDTSLNSKTICNETKHLCNVIQDFLDEPRDFLTKLNLVVISNVCPDQSIFDEFHSYKTYDGEEATRTFLITRAGIGNQKTCGIDEKITEQFVPEQDYNIVKKENRDNLINPTFVAKEIKNIDDHLLILIERENYNASLKFIAEYYNDTTDCKLEAPLNDGEIKSYLITMRMKDGEIYKEFKTVIPPVDFKLANFTLEEYLVQNLNYKLNNAELSSSPTYDIQSAISPPYGNQHVIIFTDDYKYLQSMNSNSLAKLNRTVDYILYMETPDDAIEKRLENSFYGEDSDRSSFHIMTPENSFGENICKRLKKAVPFELEPWQWALIGFAIFVFVVNAGMFYHRYIRPKNLYVEIMRNIPSGENSEELLKGCDELYIKEGKFKINFNLVKGQGLSSTVYEATIKRALLSVLPRKSFDHNNISEDYVVAAKLLNQLQQDQISDFFGEINAARKLEKHEKICTLVGWSAHLGAPCLLFELMETDLYNYILQLREPLSETSGSENGSTVTASATESEHYGVPNFDARQQKIFLQILWQASQGLEYIASKNIVHRDVAARNVLISPYGDSETFTAKITDFGLCVDVDERTKEYKEASPNKRLPLKLFAIECHFEHKFSEASDVWAFGLLMTEVYSLSGILYPGIGMNKIPEYLKEGKRMEKPEKMPQDIYEIAFGCWKEDPNLRKPFYKLSKELKEKLRTIDPENDAYRDYWHLQIEDEELMESFIPRKIKTK